MKSKVTEAGLLVPRDFFNGAEEVEIRRENDLILLIPVRKEDPILGLGRHPTVSDVTDASVNHDRYLYAP